MKSITDIFNIKTDDSSLYKTALTHPSFSKENNLTYNYERMEFLGDAVLKLMISNILYKKYPDYTEGQMSKIRSIIVSDATLFKISKQLDLPDLILLAKHEKKQGLKKLESVCACSFEAILGAFYLDGKFNEISEFIEKIIMPYIVEVDKNFDEYNSKAILQEYTQSESKCVPTYELINHFGPAHDTTFEVEVSYNKEVLATGIGKSKKEAEQQAAHKACIKLGIIKK